MDEIFYVYVHKRLSDNSVFYVGKGKGYRHKVKTGRSKEWNDIVKTHGYKSELIAISLPEELALLIELEFVDYCVSKGVKLCNKTIGGDGALSNPSKKTREKQRIAKTGVKQSKEHSKKSATAKIGKKQPRSAVDYVSGLKKKKVINSDGEIFESATEAAKKYGTTQGLISMCCRGERLTTKGKAWSYDIENVPKVTIASNKKRVRNIGTDEIFESIGDACKAYNVSNQCMSFAARKGRKCKSYYWEYI